MMITPPLARGSLHDAIDSKSYSSKPMLLYSNALVVPNPPALLSALREYIVTEARKRRLEEIINTNVMQHVSGLVQAHLLRMAWRAHDWPPIDRVSWAIESVWNLDSDKLAHVIVLVEDLRDKRRLNHEYDGLVNGTLSTKLRSRISSVSKALKSRADIPREILHLIVAQDLGSGSMMMLDLNDQDQAGDTIGTVAFLEQMDLAVISRLRQGDPLGLWKFIRLYQGLQRSVYIHSWSFLDVFGLYHANSDSFYISNQNRLRTLRCFPCAQSSETICEFEMHLNARIWKPCRLADGS